MHDRDLVSPVSLRVNVARLPRNGHQLFVEADAKARAALARIHGVEEVKSFRADLVARPWKRNGVEVEGKVVADIVQLCVVTLDPLEVHIDAPVSAVFLPEESRLGREGFGQGGEILVDAEGPDSPETFSGDSIDVGALAEEFFDLAIDPYPRGPRAGQEAASVQSDEPAEESEFQKKLKLLASKPR